MKKIYFILIMLLSVGILSSCGEYPQYEYAVGKHLPDSLIDEYENFIIETTSAASFHMSGGDYEDPEDLVRQAKYIADDIYMKRVDGLRVRPCNGCYAPFVPYYMLTPREYDIFIELKQQQYNKQ